MKKKLFLLAMCCTLAATPASAKSNTRIATGTYHDYLCIVTADGNEWLLSDEDPAHNPYMRKQTVYMDGRKVREYMPRFTDGEKVKVKFDTRGTKSKRDDVILKVYRRGK